MSGVCEGLFLVAHPSCRAYYFGCVVVVVSVFFFFWPVLFFVLVWFVCVGLVWECWLRVLQVG